MKRTSVSKQLSRAKSRRKANIRRRTARIPPANSAVLPFVPDQATKRRARGRYDRELSVTARRAAVRAQACRVAAFHA